MSAHEHADAYDALAPETHESPHAVYPEAADIALKRGGGIRV
jgi:hypothetical protein